MPSLTENLFRFLHTTLCCETAFVSVNQTIDSTDRCMYAEVTKDHARVNIVSRMLKSATL